MNNLTMFGKVGPKFYLFLILTIIFFTLVREILTWYWKQNKIVELLEEIAENTRPKEDTSKKEENKNKVDYTDPTWPFKS